ncbi:MAG: hypothetical protein HXN28_12415, partial [Prevotella histicola]|nr:hypothetical protein [Prevotella histicola]
MKKILSVLMLLLLSISIYAQQNVTKFLGIPVDGSKAAMIQKLKAKGFTYNTITDRLEGAFNTRVRDKKRLEKVGNLVK